MAKIGAIVRRPSIINGNHALQSEYRNTLVMTEGSEISYRMYRYHYKPRQPKNRYIARNRLILAMLLSKPIYIISTIKTMYRYIIKRERHPMYRFLETK